MFKKIGRYRVKSFTKWSKISKNLGINKSRGKGLVQVKIGDVIKEDSKSVDSVKGDFNYLLYEIDLKQPIKIGDSQSQYDYEQTKSYVSGSIVRGAVIGKYLKSKILTLIKLKKM